MHNSHASVKKAQKTLRKDYLDHFFDLWVCWADAAAFLDFLVDFSSSSGSSSSSSLESLSLSAGASSVSESSAEETSSSDDTLCDVSAGGGRAGTFAEMAVSMGFFFFVLLFLA